METSYEVDYNPLPAYRRKTPACWTPFSESYNTLDEAGLAAKDFLKNGYFSIEFSEVKMEDEECNRESLDHVEILNLDCEAFDVASQTESFREELRDFVWSESNRSPAEVIEKIKSNVLDLEIYFGQYDYAEFPQIQLCLDRANKTLQIWEEADG